MATEFGDDSLSDSGTGGDAIDSDVRTWAILAHAAAFAGFFIPLGNVLGPLLVWAIKRDESRFIAENGQESLNFQITWTVLTVAIGFVVWIFALGGGGLFAFALLGIVGVVWLILVVIAIIRASENEVYKYPFSLKLV